MTSPRATARQIASGQPGAQPGAQPGGTLAVPLALRVSARIAERDAGEFTLDPTQLANALRDLADAIEPDGVPVTDPGVLLSGCRNAADVLGSARLKAAAEATRRLRASFGDALALVAVLPGPSMMAGLPAADALPAAGALPAAAGAVLDLGKELLAAGADVLVVHDKTEAPGVSLTTLANVAAFHQAPALSLCVPRYGLAAAATAGLNAPARADGVVLTPGELPRDTDISVLRDWVAAVRG